MTTAQIVVLVLYALDITLCLLAIKRKDSHAYAATKPLLMPLLLGIYYNFLPVGLRTLGYQRFASLALVFHCLGDVLLLFPRSKSKRMFYLGMVSFFTGHVFYSLWFIKADVGHTNKGMVIALVLCLFLEYLLYRQLVLGPRHYAPMLIPYSFGLVLVAVSIASTMGNGSPVYATVLGLVGIGLFAFSDFCIMRRLVRLPLFGQMVVMSTYIAGQSLIVLGMLLLQG